MKGVPVSRLFNRLSILIVPWMALVFAPPLAISATIAGGTITTDTTWTLAQSPYIITGSVTVQGVDGADGITTLTIEPGVEVRFNTGNYLYVGGTSGNPGALQAIGNESQPIVFTSNQTSPWYGINFRDTASDATCIMEYCIVEKSGSANIRLDSASPAIRHSIIRKSLSYGIFINASSSEITENIINSNTSYGIYIANASSKPIISNNTFTENATYPLFMCANNSLSANTFTGNGKQAVEVFGGTITTDNIWKNVGVPYVIKGTVTVQGTDGTDGITTLTIEPGAELRFNQQNYLYIGGISGAPGALRALGEADHPITFTSAEVKLWSGIWFRDTTSDSTSVLDHCVVEKAVSVNIYIESASPAIRNTIIRESGAYGINTKSGSPEISGCTISSNGNYGVYFTNTTSKPLVNNNTFVANGYFPLRIGANTPFNGNIFIGNTIQSVEIIGETITTDRILKNIGASYTIAGNITVQGTDGPDNLTTLTIEPGVELRFNDNSYLYIGGTSGSAPGSLRAIGNTKQPIIFSNSRATWGGINFRDTSHDPTCILDHCVVEKATSYNIRVDSANPLIKNSTIQSGGSYGIYVNIGSPVISDCIIRSNWTYGLYYVSLASKPLVTNNIFVENGSYPLRIGANASLPLNRFINNTKQAIEVVGETITLDNTWKNLGIPYYISTNVTIQGTAGSDGVTTLTIEPGVELRFNQNTFLYVGNTSGNPGALAAIGDENHPILFTSNQVSAWGGINYRNTTVDNMSFIDHCIVEKAYSNIKIDSASPTITNSDIRNSSNYGICFSGSGNNPAIIQCNTIRNNVNGIYITGSYGMQISNNNIINNSSYALMYSATPALIAAHNWWGQATGPGAVGSVVSTNVTVIPYLKTARNCDILPPSYDTDFDNLPDTWELQYFGALNQNGEGDYDNDGITNAMEYILGSDPNDMDQIVPETLDFDYDGAGRIDQITR